MTSGLWPANAEFPRLNREQETARIIEILVDAARRKRARDGQPMLTELVRVAFDEERPALIRLAMELLKEEKAKNETRGPRQEGI